jgi:putative DNA-invertase from lambdoid prophage Rac
MATKHSNRRDDEDQPPRAFGYCRVSTEAQGQSELGLDAQRRKIEGRAHEMGWQLDGIYTDIISGSTPLHQRSQGSRVLALIRPGDVLCCAKLDRLTRSAIDALTVVKDFRKRGISLWALDIGSGDCTGGGVSELLVSILSAVASFERERISERIRDAKASLRTKGPHQGGSRPFGWTLGEVNGHGRARLLVEDPAERQAIGDIIDLRAAGQSLMAIRDEMRSRGHWISHNLVAHICLRATPGGSQ